MKKALELSVKYRLFILFFLISGQIMAESRYISDGLEVFYRSGPTKNYRVLGTIQSGVQVEWLAEDTENAATQIKLPSGREVWIDTADLMAEKPVHVLLEETKAEFNRYKQAAEGQITTLRNDLFESRELAAASERLQKRIAELELANEGLELRNQTLSDRSRYDMLTAGGIVAMISMFIGLLLPKLFSRRRDDGWR
jgi:SH3 domain protein